MSDEEVTINGRKINKLKFTELKAACKERNLPCSGNKTTLIKRLKAAIELENLQKAARSSPGAAALPNSDIAEDSGDNDFIKQYMENQRKLLQSSRFSSTSEADSEDDSLSHKAGSVVSPLVGTRTRRATRESEDVGNSKDNAFEAEQTQKIEESDLRLQATVKSTQEEVQETQSETVDSTVNKKDEDTPENDHREEDDKVEVLPVIEEEKVPEQEREKLNGEHVAKKDEPEEVKVQETPPDSEEPAKDERVEMPVEEQGNEKEDPNEKEVEAIPEKNVKNDEDSKLTQMEVDDDIPKDNPKAPEEDKEGTKPETITEETVVDVDEIVNQEEELDYDENDAQTQEKSEAIPPKPAEKSEPVERNRKIQLKKKDKKERRRSRSDSQREEEKKKDEEELKPKEETTEEKVETSSRKRRKSSTTESAKQREDKAKTPEPVEKKLRKRIKRQSLDAQPESVPKAELERDKDSSDTVEKAKVAEEAEEQPEVKSVDEEKIPEAESRIPFRRISLNKRENAEAAKPRKRKWGAKSTNAESVNISSDLIKDLIDVKSDEIRKAMDDQEDITEEPGELVEEEEEVDEVIDITMDEPEQETTTVFSSPEPETRKRRKHSAKDKDGEEDGEIVEEEEVVLEELVETESGEESQKPEGITQHDNRKVVKSQRSVETKNRKVVSRTEQRKSSKEGSDAAPEKRRESRKRSSKTSVTVTNKSSPKEPTPPPQPRDVSPSRHEISKIVHVRNLVRPFTVNQLKALLSKLGKVVDDSFWIDKIKSHCIISYETEEEATNARKCLHGINWPSSNPKQLSVDYCDQFKADDLRGVVHDKPIPPLMGDWKAEQKAKSENEEKTRKDEVRSGRRSAPEDDKGKRERHGRDETIHQKASDSSSKHRKEEPPRDRDRRRSPERRRAEEDRRGVKRGDRHQPMREWDKDKLDQEAEHRRQVRERERERRSPQREERREGRERRQKEEPKVEEPPAKLLDDLFRKTKAAPCIYWLPLTDEQIANRVKEREERREARNKIRREMEEEEAKNKAKLEAERRDRSARSPDRGHQGNRTRRDSTNDRRPPDRRIPGRPQERDNRDRPSPLMRKKSRSPKAAAKKPSKGSSSGSSSSDSSSGSGSGSDSDSDSSSGSPSPKKAN